MGLKTSIEKNLLTPAEIEILAQLAVEGNIKRVGYIGTRTIYTVKAQMHNIYNKVEDFDGERPYLGNILLFAIFGKFLTEEEARHLIESGELHDWRIGVQGKT